MSQVTMGGRRDRVRRWFSGRSTSQSGSTLPVPSPPSTSPSTTSRGTTVTPQKFQARVLRRLSQQDQDTIQQYTPTNTTDIDTIIQHALSAAKQKQAICKAKRWTFTFGGRQVVLQEKADNIVKWLDRFKQVGDVASNADPVHVGLPWAGIRLLLEVSKMPYLNSAATMSGIILY